MRTARFFGVVISLFAGLLIFSRLVNVWNFFSVSTGSNEPTFKLSGVFFTTKLKPPKLLDFICYYADDEYSSSREIRFHRVCGMENDTVEIRNGICIVNGKNVDRFLELKHLYALSPNDLSNLKIEDEDSYVRNEGNVTLLFLEDAFSVRNNLHSKMVIQSLEDKLIALKYGKQWNIDNFGPVIVPKNSFFVLGDNRHNSLDSRYLGFVSKDDFVGTVLRKNPLN